MQKRTAMQSLEVFPTRDPESTDVLILKLRVQTPDSVMWRSKKIPKATALQRMYEEGERLMLDRSPGALQYQFVLPMTDCGYALP